MGRKKVPPELKASNIYKKVGIRVDPADMALIREVSGMKGWRPSSLCAAIIARWCEDIRRNQ